MSTLHRLVITAPETAAQFSAIVKFAESKPGTQDLINYLASCLSGVRNCSIATNVNAVKGTLTGTFTGAPTATDTLTINGVAFTAVASGATGNQFNIGASVTEHATNAAAAINASTTAGIAGVVTASSSAGVLTITADVPGLCGNYPLAEAMDNFAWAGAATRMASGADGTAKTLTLGS